MNNDFKFFMECLIRAGLKMKQPYFKINIAGSTKPIFRERIYCYELYHQLRNVLGDHSLYILHGEFDKSGHPIIQKLIGALKPDFIIHKPSVMKKNLVVIEVKPVNVINNIDDLRKDIHKLKLFIKCGKYYRGIMLIYSDIKEKIPHKIKTSANHYIKKYRKKILLMWHPGPKEKPEIIEFE